MRSIIRFIQESLTAIGSIVVNILLFPIRAIFLPFESMLKSMKRPDAALGGRRDVPEGFFSAILYWFKRFGVALATIPLQLLKAPVVFVQGMSKANLYDLLFALPAILMFVFLGFVAVQVFIRADSIENRYRQGTAAAVKEQDLNLAKTYFNRLEADNKLRDRDRLSMVDLLARTNEVGRAKQLLNDLAPDDKPGFGPAHERKAIIISEQLKRKRNMKRYPKARRLLRHHLDNASNTNQAAMFQAWATYHTANEDFDLAANSYRDAAKTSPYFYVVLSDLYTRQGRTGPAENALNDARKAFEVLLTENERKDVDAGRIRNTLADILIRLRRYDDAEKLLRQALAKNFHDPDRRQMAQLGLLGFYLKRYDKSIELDEDFSQQFRYLTQALALTENQKFDPVYARMANLYNRNRSVEEAQECKKVLLDAIASDNPSVTAMFAMSNIYWAEGNTEKAEKYLEDAYNLQPQFLDVANNLAWMLAHSEEPDMDRALELSTSVIEKAPRNPMYRDTYASILFQRKNYGQAIVEFQKALPRISESHKKGIHEKLAVCYQETGDMDLSERHKQRAEEKAAAEPKKQK